MTKVTTEQFGIHFMMDGYGAPESVLKDKAELIRILDYVPKALSMHPISEPTVVEVGPLNRKDPGGLSGFVMIAESHISFHTFPKRGFVTIDVYTCQNELDTGKLTTLFKDLFKLDTFEVMMQKRGTRYPSDDIY